MDLELETERKVEMIRIKRPEEVYDREEIFGRDASSVFPKTSEAAASGSAPSLEALKESLGARKFISESELETLKSSRGGSVEDGSIACDRPLAEVLRDNKDKKNEAFQDMWKQMKTGKNRPLDADELAFYDNLIEEEHRKEVAWSNLQRQEMDDFRKAVQESAASSKPEGMEFEEGSTKPQPPPAKPAAANKAPAPSRAMPTFRPVLKVKPKDGATVVGVKRGAACLDSSSKEGKVLKSEGPSSEAAGSGGAATDAAAKADGSGDEEGLAGLLGGYGSDSD